MGSNKELVLCLMVVSNGFLGSGYFSDSHMIEMRFSSHLSPVTVRESWPALVVTNSFCELATNHGMPFGRIDDRNEL